MTRRSTAGLILLIWLVAMGWLAAREIRPRRTDTLSDASLKLPPGASFYTLSMGQQTIGFASNTIDTVAEGIRLQDVMVMEIPALGTLHRTDVRTEAVLSRTLHLKNFRATLQAEAGTFVADGEVLGDTLLLVNIDAEDKKQELRVPLTRPIVLPALMPVRLALGGQMAVGKTFQLDLFDPLALKDRSVEVAVTAQSTMVVADSADQDSVSGVWFPIKWDTLRVWQIEQRSNGVDLVAWIDNLGRLVRAVSPLGFVMQRSAFEVAYENFRKRDTMAVLKAPAGDVIQQTAVASNVTIPRTGVGRLKVLLGGVPLSGFDLDGDRQELSGDTLTVTREAATGNLLRAMYRLPNLRSSQFGEYLKPEPLVQSLDPRIAAQARQIVGNITDPARAAELLVDWVYRNVTKKLTVSVPSALRVLESRTGDCNEHTVLYVALARALGLPARTAAGLVYSNGSFYFHAWPEVYLNGWVAVDPTFGQYPADAAHLRFTIGGLARQMDLIQLIGRVTVNVVATQGS